MPRRSAPPSSSPPRPTPIPAKFWRACAGISAQAPVVNSRVYYFPQGHIDQAASQPRNLSPLVYSRPVIPCRVAAVNFFADPNTDEVFLKILLLPVTDGSAQDFLSPAVAAEGSGNGNGDDEKVESYAKILTRSDANNGGGFSVPRFCADLIFPPLNFEEDPPVQTLRITDLHGAVWEFRHIYRGTPRRHLFTSGWSKFVNSKKIVSGDTVVFMKDSDGRMFVGIRRNMSSDDGISDGGLDWLATIVGMDEGEKEKEEENEEVIMEGFARNGKGRVSSASVAEAMELAAQSKPFEVVYYPSVGWGEFVVKAEDVDVKMNGILCSVGMRVKMARENYDSSRMTWFQGTVSGVTVPDEAQPWSGSPWRMLQITWDESEILKNVSPVSPWQVEFLSDTPSLPQVFSPTKKFRIADGSSKIFSHEVEESSFSMTRLAIPDLVMGVLNQTLLMSSYGTPFPASIQGVRHPLLSAPTCPIFPINPPLSIANSFKNNIRPRLNAMLPEPNIDTHKPEGLSAHNKSSLTPNSNSTKSGTASFQLFGCTIQTDQASDEIDDQLMTIAPLKMTQEKTTYNRGIDKPIT